MEVLNDRALYCVHRSFAETRYGEQLATSLRFERYNLGGLTNQEWEELLGADVNNLRHMQVSYALAKVFIRDQEALVPDSFSKTEKDLFKLGLLIHDQAESVVSDISYSLKTEADEADEREQFAKLQPDFCPGVSDGMLTMLTNARDTVVFDDTGHLGRKRAAVEHMGYMRTMLRASDAIDRNLQAEVDAGLRWLVADVLGNMTCKMLAYAADETSPLRAYVYTVTPRISRAFKQVEESDFIHYKDHQKQKAKQFMEARRQWEQWVAAQESIDV